VGLVTGINVGTTNIIYKNSTGCSDTIVFTVLAQPAKMAIETFGNELEDLNNKKLDLSNESGITALSIKANLVNDEIKVYPNPTKDWVIIESPIKLNVKLLDMFGREILYLKDASKINLSSFNDGNYVLILFDEYDSFLGSKRIIKVTQ
jgi:hypothetical protein